MALRRLHLLAQEPVRLVAHAVWSLDRVVWWEYLPLNFAGRLKWWHVLWTVVFRGAPRMVVRADL